MLTKHRYSFINALSYVPQQSQPLRVPIPIVNRVASAICKTLGPAVSVRDIHKHIKGLSAKLLRLELDGIVKMEFGVIYEGDRNMVCYMKPHPSTLQENNKVLKMAAIPFSQYTSSYMNTQKMSNVIVNAALLHHPHQELLLDILSQDDPDSDSDKEN